MSARVVGLGWCPVKGTGWHETSAARVEPTGLEHDRLWTPVTPDLGAVRATDVPWLAGLRVELDDLPSAGDLLFDGTLRSVAYYDRTFSCQLFGGALSEEIGRRIGREVLLARTIEATRFIWSSPVSVLFTSELAARGLPTDTERYRPNIVIDDLTECSPLMPSPGDRLHLDQTVLQVERELDRCIVINHNATTGDKDQDLLRRLRPGALLAHGCRVLTPGVVRLGSPLRVERTARGRTRPL